MARSLGIRLGHRRASLVLLDGAVKRPKLRAHLEVELAPDVQPSPTEVADALARAAKAAKLKTAEEQIRLAIDPGSAAFRPLALPFAEKGKIEEVLKFEIESRLPQWDIEDVVCDFHVRRSTPVESDLLVVAVPKTALGERIGAMTKAGIEPHEVELETSALFEAARQAGLLAPDAAQVLVHVGDRTTAIVVTEAGRLVSMRALPLDLENGTASEAVADEAEPQASAESQPPPEPAAADPVRRRQAAERLARELLRVVSGGAREQGIAQVYVCGVAVPEFVSFGEDGEASGPHARIGDVPLAPLDALREIAPEIPIEQRLRLVPAYGAALHGLGANGLTPHLRREDLRYAGKFERLEVPLGVLGLVLLTLTTALYIVDYKVIDAREADLRLWIQSNHNYMIGSTAAGSRARLPLAPDEIRNYSRRIADDPKADPVRTPYEQLEYLSWLVDQEARTLERDLGTRSDVEPPQSALEAMTVVLDTIRSARDRLGRFSIREIRADTRTGNTSAQDHVNVVLNMTFWGESVAAAAAYTDLIWALENQPWATRERQAPTNTLDGGGGIFVDGIEIKVDTRKIVKSAPGGRPN